MDSHPDDITTLRAEVALARARMAEDAATIAHQKLEIAKLRRQIYGPRSERTARLIEQMELALEELRTITRYLVFPTWRSLITTLTTGQPPPQR